MSALAALLLGTLVLAALLLAPLAAAQEDNIQRGIDADAARYTALARYYGAGDGSLAFQDGFLAANPELVMARRYSSTAALAAGDAPFAANPELLIVRRYSPTAAPAASYTRFILNPELIGLDRYETCGC
jgi:hypothetical protein